MTEIIGLPARKLYLDFLRGIAILYIVGINHLDDYAHGIYYYRLNGIVTYSFMGLFVFISGYLLSINNIINNKNDLLKFIYKRFLRIYPLYVLALFAFMACSLMSFESVILHALLLNIILAKSVLTLWFVAMICIFYLFYPIIAYKYSITKTSILFIVVYSICISMKIMYGLIDIKMLIYFPLFVLGILSYKHQLLDKYVHKTNIVLISVILFIATSMLYLRIDKLHYVMPVLFMTLSLPSLLIIGEFLSSVISEYIYVPLAYASFCMFLFHRVVFISLLKLYTPNNDIYITIYLSAFGIPLTFMCSYIIQKQYDGISKMISNSLLRIKGSDCAVK
jgi:peptidoglycan/LPS O-acetylase OafA/YrhL